MKAKAQLLGFTALLVLSGSAAVWLSTGPDEVRLLPVCERQHFWDLDAKTLQEVRRRTPLRFVTVCGLSGSGHDWSISAGGESRDAHGRLISIDTPIPGRHFQASCRKTVGGDFGVYVWAKTHDGLFCHVPTGEKGL
jgi:hypothetical protein